MAQDFNAVKQRIDAKLAQVNAQFAEAYPGMEARNQVEYWPETLGEAEQQETINYEFKSTCPQDGSLREAIRAAIATGAYPDFNVLSTKAH